MLPPSIKRALFLFVLLISFACTASAQQFYVNTSDYRLYSVKITPAGLDYQEVSGCGSGYFSIAISGNQIYYNTIYGTLNRADLTGGATQVTGNCTMLPSTTSANSLTVDKSGKIYYVNGNQLYSVTSNESNPTFIADLPYYASGDLVFYDNELYMASGQGIVKIPLNNPASSSLYISIPDAAIFGLTTVLINNKISVYALTGGGSGTNLLELDMQNQSVKNIVGTLPFTVYDAGSGVEAGIVPVIEVTAIDVTRECDVINQGHAVVLTAPHSGTYTYKLNSGQSNTTGVFDHLDPGIYKLTISSDGGETDYTSEITVPDFTLNDPVITATKINPVCNIKGSIKLDAGSAGSNYNILYNNQLYSFDKVFDSLNAGTYHFTITTLNGCVIAEKDYILDQDVCPPITIDNVIIEAECVIYGRASVKVVTKTHPDSYTYELNGVTNTDGLFNNLLPGEYTLTVTSSGGDRKEQTVTVPDFKIVNKPALTYNLKNAVCSLAGQITFTANGDLKGASKILYGSEQYDIGQTIKNLYLGTNHFNILNAQGCILDQIDVEVMQDKCEPVDFPDTFTPNGDGINDIFRPNQNSNPLNYRFIIFNRLGQQVFLSKSVFNGWDGTYNNNALPGGVYYWLANYTMPDGKVMVKKGWVTLIR
jgi:gliding motility-associated-like protein